MFTALIITNLIISLTLKNSIILSLTVIMQAFLYSLFISLISYSSWMSYFLFIVLLGGILIVFLYVIITTCHESSDSTQLSLYMIYFMAILLFFIAQNQYFYTPESMSWDNSFMYNSMTQKIWLMTIHSPSFSKLSIFLMSLLFFMMVIVVFMSKDKKGSNFKPI
uniref:NADH dehydrogenase subunit 6 n=1 Tax=Aeolothrips indicus TaxID=2856552 RepID=A0A8F5PNC3_9NEOP|nr:NADH dehydrogenase subunit 6 [Aeolothrips indicus]